MKDVRSLFLPALSSLVLLSGCGRNDAIAMSPLGPQEPEQSQVIEFADRFERRFAVADPQINTMVEEFTAYDEDGEPFEMGQVRGKPTVMVFGCLT